MKYKVSELTGTLLDAAVAKAEGLLFDKETRVAINPETKVSYHPYSPSTLWEQGGPVIENWWIAIFTGQEHWGAQMRGRSEDWIDTNVWDTDIQRGPTPLVAAMRVLVWETFGEEVEL